MVRFLIIVTRLATFRFQYDFDGRFSVELLIQHKFCCGNLNG